LIGLLLLVGIVAVDLRRALRGLQALVPLWTAIGRDTQRVLRKTGELVDKADHGAAHVVQVVDEACETAHVALAAVKRTTRHFGINGARKAPRGRF
jgi:hypothetical protein